MAEITDEKAMVLSAGNAALLWRLLADARGDQFTDHGSFAAVDPGSGQGAFRVIRYDPGNAAADDATIGRLAGRLSGPDARRARIEDPFGQLDLTRLGMEGVRLPVMLRDQQPGDQQPGDQQPADQQPGDGRAGARPAEADVEVWRAADAGELAAAEKAIVAGFPMQRFMPYRRGAMFPPALLRSEQITVFLALRGGQPAGGCLALSAGGDGGVYSVATQPGHRSRGVGRALMHAALRHLGQVPVTLVATEAGLPLYRSLGFRVAGYSTWWGIRS